MLIRRSIKEKSLAKINLSLKVIEKQTNNYHRLESLVCFANYYDTLKIKINKTKKINIKFIKKEKHAFIPQKEDNSIIEAWNYLNKLYSKNVGFDIKVLKKLPAGAGLGCASSNSAAFIRAYHKLLNLDISKLDLKEIAHTLGADIPVCIKSQLSFMQGIGEEINQIKSHKKIWIIVIFQGEHISTKDIFNKVKKYSLASKHKNFKELFNYTNDLEEPAKEQSKTVNKTINRIKNIADRNKIKPIKIGMSGSGSSCFVCFSRKKELNKIYKEVLINFPKGLIFKSQII